MATTGNSQTEATPKLDNRSARWRRRTNLMAIDGKVPNSS
jgi:hypothetical protein